MTEDEQYAQYVASQNRQTNDDLEYAAYLKSQEVGTQQEKVVNEMPEGLKGRFVYKNFGADPVASFNYLQKENPDFELKTDKSGEVLARKRGTQVWGRLDPKGFDWRDITDVAYDAPAAVAQGAVTAASGLAGAFAGGIGAIPAAMAGSALSGAGLEVLRQAFGRGAGIEDNFSGQDVGIALGAGAVSPLLFGTGAGVKEAVKASLKGGAKQTVKEILATQRGLIGRGYDATFGTVMPRTASILGGYRPETIKAAQENLGLIQAAKNDPQVAVSVLQEGKEKVINGLQSSLDATGMELENLTKSLDVQGAVIPTEEILTPIRELQKRLKTTGIQSDERKALIKRLEGMIEDNFTVKTKIEPELSIDQILARAAGKPELSPIPIPEATIKKEIPEFLTATQANEAYFALKALAQDSGVDLSKIGQLKGVIKSGGMNDMRVARAFNQATKKSKDAIKNVAEQAGAGEEYNGLNASYSQLKEFQDLFNTATKDEAAYQRFLSKRGSTADFAKQKVSNMIGEDVNKLGHKMQAIELFANPQWEIPAFGQSNTGRTVGAAALGGSLGYLAGREYGDGSTFLPTMIGAGLGRYAAGPVAIKKLLQANQFLRQTIPQHGIGGIPYSQEILRSTPYLMMNTNLNDQGAK